MTTADKVKAALVITIMGAAIIGEFLPNNKPEPVKDSSTTMRKAAEMALESINAKAEYNKRVNATYGYTDYDTEYMSKAVKSTKVDESEDSIDYEAERIAIALEDIAYELFRQRIDR